MLNASVGKDYSKVNPLRTSLDGLREWLGVSSILESEPIVDRNNRVKGKQYTLKCPDDIGTGNPVFEFFHIGPPRFLEIRLSFMIWFIWKAILMRLSVGKRISKIIGPCVIFFVFQVGRSILFQ